MHLPPLTGQDIAFAAGSGFVTLSLAVSGGFVPLPKIPALASWLQWTSPAKYTFQALAIAQFEGSRLEVMLDEMELRRPASIGANLLVLVGMYIMFTVATAAVLARKQETR